MILIDQLLECHMAIYLQTHRKAILNNEIEPGEYNERFNQLYLTHSTQKVRQDTTTKTFTA